MKKRIYIVPVKSACNANCSFCITKTQERFLSHLPHYLKDFKQFILTLDKISQQTNIEEFEITGGGEPFLHRRLDSVCGYIKAFFPQAYIKIYTNGFVLPANPIKRIDEINLSRVHHNSERNNEIYQSSKQNEIVEALKYFKKNYKKVRLNVVMMKGYIDSLYEVEQLIDVTDQYVDQFFIRELFEKCDLEKEKYVNLEVEHPKVKMDKTKDYCGSQPIIGSDGILYSDWTYRKRMDLTQKDLGYIIKQGIIENKKGE
jgi:molybdenum cofactor biosynthesis enzyme MoaA